MVLDEQGNPQRPLETRWKKAKQPWRKSHEYRGVQLGPGRDVTVTKPSAHPHLPHPPFYVNSIMVY